MPLYKTDSKGNLYQANASRHDGRGFEALPATAEGGDVTLGEAYRKGEIKRNRKNSLRTQLQAIEDKKDELKRIQKKNLVNQIRTLEEKRMEVTRHPEYQKKLLYEASLQSLSGVKFTPAGLSGNGLSANGRMGEEALTSEQKNANTAIFQQFEKNPVAIASQDNSRPVVVPTRSIPFKFFLSTPSIPLAQVAQVKQPSIPLTDYYERQQFQLSRVVKALDQKRSFKEAMLREKEEKERQIELARAKGETVWNNSILDTPRTSILAQYFSRRK